MKRFESLVAFAAVLASSVSAEEFAPRHCDIHLLSVRGDGEVTEGSKAALIEAVESGRAIRVGFGLGQGETGGYFLTHWFEAKFLTVLGEEVFTQTPQIHRQRPDREAGDVTFPDKAQLWVATMGTNGKLYSRFLDEDSVASHRVDSWWCQAD